MVEKTLLVKTAWSKEILLVKSDMVDGHGDAVDDPSLADPALPWDRERADVGGDREQQEEHERGHPLHSFAVLRWGHQPFWDFLEA